jgi:hypothetical protein
MKNRIRPTRIHQTDARRILDDYYTVERAVERIGRLGISNIAAHADLIVATTRLRVTLHLLLNIPPTHPEPSPPT